MKKILVLTDFSDSARHAAEYAVHVAVSLNAQVKLLHIYQVPLLYPEKIGNITQDDLQKIAGKELSLLAEDLEKLCNKKVEITTEIRTGTFFVELMYACAHLDPYLVIMGSYGNTASRQLLWGSHTTYAMKHLPFPLLAVPATASYKFTKRICFFFDGKSVTSLLPLDGIITVAKDLNAQLYVACITDEDSDNEVRLHCSTLARELASLHPDVHMIDNHQRDANILSFCERFSIDLLIVVPNDHSLLDIFHQNNVRQFISHSNIPVLALHKKLFY